MKRKLWVKDIILDYCGSKNLGAGRGRVVANFSYISLFIYTFAETLPLPAPNIIYIYILHFSVNSTNVVSVLYLI